MAVPRQLVSRSDEVMSGAVVFAGTRVPVQTLLDYLEEGDTLDIFWKTFQQSAASTHSPSWSCLRNQCSRMRILLDECVPRRFPRMASFLPA